MRNVIDAGPEINDADSAVTKFKHSWWVPGQHSEKYFAINTARECLEFHHARRKDTVDGAEETTPLRHLFQSNYIFPSSAFGDVPVPPGKQPCTRCRLYRAVALGSQDKLRDLRNSLQGGMLIFCSATHLSICKAASFNQLYEAVVNKEAALVAESTAILESAPAFTPIARPATASKGKKRAEAAEDWRMLSEEQLKHSQHIAQSQPSGKWVWGPDLTEEDLKSLVRGGDRNNELPHSGYDESLDDASIGSLSPPVNIARFIEGGDPPFFQLSPDIMDIPDLEPHQYPAFQIADNPLPFGQRPVAAEQGAAAAEQGAAGMSKKRGKRKAGAESTVDQPLLPLPPKNYVKLPNPIAYRVISPREELQHGRYKILLLSTTYEQVHRCRFLANIHRSHYSV